MSVGCASPVTLVLPFFKDSRACVTARLTQARRSNDGDLFSRSSWGGKVLGAASQILGCGLLSNKMNYTIIALSVNINA